MTTNKTSKTIKTTKDWLQEKPFSLVLSCGFFAFYSHSGFLCALEDSGIRPNKISGCSAGAIVGAAWASGTSAYDIRDGFFELTPGQFMDPALGLGLLKGKKLQETLGDIISTDFDKLDIETQIVAFDIMKMKAVPITSGNLLSAVQASCAVPGMFHPVQHNGRWFYDGALHDRIGLTGLSEQERVFCHFINFAFYDYEFEMKPMVARDSENSKLMMVKDMPGINILDLEQGKQTWQYAYDKTMEMLAAPVFDGHINEMQLFADDKQPEVQVPAIASTVSQTAYSALKKVNESYLTAVGN